jgi:acetyltransferase
VGAVSAPARRGAAAPERAGESLLPWWLPAEPTPKPDALHLAVEHLRLADGRCARLRPIGPGDAEAAQAFVAALSARSRRLRFHGALKRLPEPVLRAMTAIDFDAHVALVAEAGCSDGAQRLVADARYVRDDQGEPGEAEFAIAVADDWQGLGLGRGLMQRLAVHARARGVQALHGAVLADNVPMLSLMQRLGARLRRDATDATLMRASFVL